MNNKRSRLRELDIVNLKAASKAVLKGSVENGYEVTLHGKDGKVINLSVMYDSTSKGSSAVRRHNKNAVIEVAPQI